MEFSGLGFVYTAQIASHRRRGDLPWDTLASILDVYYKQPLLNIIFLKLKPVNLKVSIRVNMDNYHVFFH